MKTLQFFLFIMAASLTAFVGCSDKDKVSNPYNPYGRYVRQGQYCMDIHTGQPVPWNYCQYGTNGQYQYVYDYQTGQCVDYRTRMPAPHPSYCQNGGYPNQPGLPQPGFPGAGPSQMCTGYYIDPQLNNWVLCNYGNPQDTCRGRQMYNQYYNLVYCQY